MRPRLNRRSRGFTLVELLVAIMILTLFMTASMGAVRIASRSWAVGQERSDATEEMRATADFLRRQFAQLPSLTIGEGDEERLAFAADEKRMRFVAPAPQYSHGAGLITYLLEVTTIDEQTLLTLRYAAFDPGSDELSHDNLSEPIILGAGFDGRGHGRRAQLRECYRDSLGRYDGLHDGGLFAYSVRSAGHYFE